MAAIYAMVGLGVWWTSAGLVICLLPGEVPERVRQAGYVPLLMGLATLLLMGR